jgi:hypothetical protein
MGRPLSIDGAFRQININCTIKKTGQITKNTFVLLNFVSAFQLISQRAVYSTSEAMPTVPSVGNKKLCMTNNRLKTEQDSDPELNLQSGYGFKDPPQYKNLTDLEH